MADNYDPNQPRAPKGATNGGQWVKTPGGGKRAAGTWTKARRDRFIGRGLPPENTVDEDRRRAQIEDAERDEAKRIIQRAEAFKQGKREAAARFAEKQRLAKAKGMRPPAAIRKYLREQEAAGIIKWNEQVNMGKEGVWWKGGRFKGQWEQKFVNLGEKSPGKKHKLLVVKSGVHEWENATPPKPPTPPPPVEDKAVVHARHKALREAKAIQTFKARKNWAAKNLQLRRKGRPELPHPDEGLVRGQVSPGGKFIRANKRNKNRGIVRGKGEWRLLPTAERGKHTGQRIMPRHVATGEQSRTGASGVIVRPINAVNRPAPRPATPKSPTPQIRVSDDGQMSIKKIEFGKEGQGIFDKQFVEVQESGRKAIMKSNGYGDAHRGFHGFIRGFAHREVAAYQLSEQLGLGVVPETTSFTCSAHPLKKSHGNFHSIQYLVPNAKDGEALGRARFHDNMVDKTEIGRMFLLDCILGNPDRHGLNWMGATDSKGEGHLWAIDNGLQMFEDEESATRMLSRWRCEMKDLYKKQLPLQNSYKAKVQKIIDDGSLQKLVDYIDTNTDSIEPKLQRDFKNAVGKRAQSIVDNWDALFSENPDKR